MKVKELIVVLQRKDPNARVLLLVGDEELYAEIDPELRELPVDRSVVIYPKS